MSSNSVSKPRYRPSVEKCKQLRWDILTEGECVDCGEGNPLLLDFDHRDPSTKVDNISTLVSKGYYDKLVVEVEKCDLRCANCHRLKSAMEMEYHKDFINWDNPDEFSRYMHSFLNVSVN